MQILPYLQVYHLPANEQQPSHFHVSLYSREANPREQSPRRRVPYPLRRPDIETASVAAANPSSPPSDPLYRAKMQRRMLAGAPMRR
ncbi:hypothetical protein TRAPUB_12611 [Trametes pubescens]|uniref:Uncharacterized protein n=1 Tax=Trametes pubescens TaxID=154538 RepID=A0A1M2VTI0_TRAPU|nr:hypothetical protein TRAPUB_12611 [Trametes pubescens]